MGFYDEDWCCLSDEDEDPHGICDSFPFGTADPDFPGCELCSWYAENFLGSPDDRS